MSAGPIVTNGGHEVYYGSRSRRAAVNEPMSGSLDAHANLPQPTGPQPTGPQPIGGPRAVPPAIWPVSAVLAAGLLVLLAVILMRHTRR
jgi:hypothetical protein